jgi:hypothetical protein
MEDCSMFRALIACFLMVGGCVREVPPSGDNPPPPGSTDMGGQPGSDDQGPPPAPPLVADAVLQSVTTDQTLMAILLNAADENGVTDGDLRVMSPSGTVSTPVGGHAWAASFGYRTSVIAYLANPTASIDANSTAVYGSANLWMPGMSAGARVSSGLAPLHVNPPDNSFALFWDTSTASLAGTGDVKLARSKDCAGAACQPLTLASSLTGVFSMAAAADSAYGAFVVRNAATSFDVYLVNVTAGTATKVVTAGPSSSFSFSPDGALLAAVAPGNLLQVFSTATGAASSWSALPAGAKALQVSFADPSTLIVRATPAGTTAQTAYRTTATATTPVATGIVAMELPRNSSLTTGTARFLFVNTTVTGKVGDVVAYDLSATTPTAIPVATAASLSSIAVSYDQTYARLLESFDTTSMTGTLTAVALPSGTATPLANMVSLTSPSFAGSHTLFYFDDSTATGTLTAWDGTNSSTYGTGVQEYRVRFTPSTVYFSSSVGVYATALQ